MSTIASLAVLLTTDISQFGKGLKDADGKTDAWVSKLGSSLGGAVTGIGAGLIGVVTAAAGAIGVLAGAGIERIDQLGDTAQRLGITTDKLSELRYAANLTGSSAEDLDAGLQKMSSNLGDAAVKSGPVSDALKRLGLDAKTLASESPDVAFKKISDGMAKIPNSAERASLAMDIFGKGGIKLLNTLGAGSGELDKLSTEAQKFGLSISQIDHAKIAGAKDEMDRAWAAVEGLGNQLAIQLAPIVSEVAQAFSAWFGDAMNGGKGVEKVIDGLVGGAAWLADAWNAMGRMFTSVFAWIEDGAGRALKALGLGGQDLIDDAKLIRAGLEAELEGGTPGQKILKRYDAFKSKVEESAKAVAKLAEENAKGGKAIAAVSEDQKKHTDELAKFAEDLEKKSKSPLEKYREEIGKIGEALDMGFIDQKTADRSAKAAHKEFGGETKFAGATQLGSREAYSSLIAASTGRSSGMSTLEKYSADTLSEAKRQTTLLATIAASKPQTTVEMAL
jgi:hypothetical protein